MFNRRSSQGSPRVDPAASLDVAQTMSGLRSIVERITPWLLDLGSWMFGALLAFDLLILGALLTVGPADTAVLTGTAAFALALPADVSGFLLLRLAADMKTVSLSDVATSAFQEVGFTVDPIEGPATDANESEKRRTGAVLNAAYGLLMLALLCTATGTTASLWYMAWWIAIAFLVMFAATLGIATRALMAGRRHAGRWRSPSGKVEPPIAHTPR